MQTPKTSRIAVICATHPLPNPGMVSADFAIDALRRRYQLPGTFEYYRMYTPEERNPETAPARRNRFLELSRSPIEYRSLRTELASVRAADAIVYWGDFLHSREFLMQTAGVLAKIGAVATHHDAMQTVFRTLYLDGESDDTVRKAYLFGGTLLFNTVRDYADARYRSALSALVRGASGVWMREVYSVATTERLGCASARLGADCALLLRPGDVDLFPGGTDREDAAAAGFGGIFFGRNASPAHNAVEFARAICDEMGVRGEWLPWFDMTLIGDRFATAKGCFQGLAESPLAPAPTTGDLLRRLSGYRIVVTDTYHLCVNAWNLGVPAVCVGESFPGVPFDVSAGWYGSWRDKRQVFYSMQDLQELYATAEELAEPGLFARRLHVVLDAIRDRAFISSAVNGIRERAMNAERLFLEALRRHFAAPGGGGGLAPC